MGKEPKEKRLREIITVIHKHNIARGVTPEKLRMILEDLGPTYIKLGQIMSMRSDIFPKKICDELMRLRSDVKPMPYEEVKRVIAKSYGMEPDQKLLYSDISEWLAKYGTAGFGNLNMGTLLQDLMDIMKENKVSMPHTLTMLVRGLTTIEGVIAQIAPDINVVQIAAARMSQNRMEDLDWKQEIEDGGKELYRAVKKGIKIRGCVKSFL